MATRHHRGVGRHGLVIVLLQEATAAAREAGERHRLLSHEAVAPGDDRMVRVQEQRADERCLRAGPCQEQVAQALQRMQEEVLQDGHAEARAAQVHSLPEGRLQVQLHAAAAAPPAARRPTPLRLVESVTAVQDRYALGIVLELLAIVLQEIKQQVPKGGRRIVARVPLRGVALQEVEDDVAEEVGAHAACVRLVHPTLQQEVLQEDE
mmetsp:Transcript_118460/g.295574  ORF Transcript_118460/g.295574 Transcript_118460/m.295574 type:complete len:208 (-) Transcript_118460:794-1417(-)